jgi:hypothetical protein
MRAKVEYEKWCALERAWEVCLGLESWTWRRLISTGFNRAIQLMETFLEEKEYENFTKTTSSRPNTEGEETFTGNRH